MKKANMHSRISMLLVVVYLMVSVISTSFAAFGETGEIKIVLSDSGITADDVEVGTDSGDAVYISNDIIYYENRTTYDSGNTYGEGTSADMHTAQEAAAHTVVNITKAGTYRLSGSLSAGQIRVDLGDDAESDPSAVVTLILDSVDITCTVAPAILFYNVYECDGNWSTATASSEVDTSKAGANVIISDGSVNTVNGSYVAKIYKDTAEMKKLWKQDGAFYSYKSMNINGGAQGTGVLNINAENEGLNSELHLTINGGNINIFSNDDGINTNEDGVSVTTINGGTLHIVAGLGAEGDGVDSNGWLVINGGTVIATANPGADSGLDSDMGSYVNGGVVVALGSTMDWAESESNQVTMNLQFASTRSQKEAIVITDQSNKIVFAYDPAKDEVTGSNIRNYKGAIVSCGALEVGETYYVYLGGEITGSDAKGVFDVSTISAFKGGTRQTYTGTDVGQVFPGGGGNWGGSQQGGSSAASEYFYLSDKVNAFSGVANGSYVSDEEYDVEVQTPEKFEVKTEIAGADDAQAGDTITVKCIAVGGESPYYYTFYALKDGIVEYKSVVWSVNDSADITLETAGTYKIMTYCKDMSGSKLSVTDEVIVS